MSQTGGVHICGWKRGDEDNYVGWVKKRPSIRTEAETLEELEEELQELVYEAYNPEALIEFDPPLPVSKGKQDLFRDDLVSVGLASHFRCSNSTTLFAKGNCPECRMGLGRRNRSDMVVNDIWPGHTSFLWDDSTNAQLLIVSEEFLSLLRPNERRQFDVRPVQMPPRKRTRFLEIVPRKFVPPVGVKGIPARGWKCRQCGYRHVGYFSWIEGFSDAIQRRSLGANPPPLFFVGDATHYELVLPRKRLMGLREYPAGQGLTSERIAVVDDSRAVLRPKLRLIQSSRKK